MPIKLADGTELVMTEPLKETLQAGLLVDGAIRINGISNFILPRHQTNLVALDSLISPDAAGPRRKYIDIKCDIGEYDRIYVTGFNASGISVRVEWSQHPLVLASRTAITDLDIGSFTYNREQIQARQNILSIVDSADRGEQYPTVQFGQIIEKASLTRRPHISWPMHRPHVNPHWLLNKLFCALGFNLENYFGDGGPSAQDIAYLLREDVGSGLEEGRYLRMSKFDSNVNDAGKFHFFWQRSFAIPSQIEDPQNRLLLNRIFAPQSGVYKFKIHGMAASLPEINDFGRPDNLEDNGFQVLIKVYDPTDRWPIATIETRGVLELGEPEDVGKFYSFEHEEEIWLSEGQKIEIQMNSPLATRGYAYPEPYYLAGLPIGTSRPDWPNEPLASHPGEGLVIEAECIRSWFSYETVLDWRNILNPKISVLDVLKGVQHCYNAKVDYDAENRTIHLRPPYDTQYGTNPLPGHYLNDAPTLIPLRQVSEPSIIPTVQERPDKVEVGFAGGDDHAYTYEREQIGLTSTTMQSRNPLFTEVEERIIATVRDSAYYTAELNGQTIRSATGVRYTVVNNTDDSYHPYPAISDGPLPEWNVAPYMLRYFGNARKKFIPNSELNFSLLPPAAASLQELNPQGIDPDDNVRDYWYPAYAAHVTSLQNDDGTPITTPPCSYLGDDGFYNMFWKQDFEARYNGYEIAQEFECSRQEARALSFRKEHLVNYKGRPVRCALLITENSDGLTARCRFVAIEYQGCDVSQGVDCSLNAAYISVFVENEEAWATFGYTHQETPISITTEYNELNGGWIPYIPGDKLLFRGAALSFRTTVTYENCPPVQIGEDVGVVQQIVPCGTTPLIEYSYDNNKVEAYFVNGDDLVDFPFSDVMEVDVDGAGFIPYTPGTVITGFTTITARRTAQRTATCPVKIGEITIESLMPSTPNVSAVCNNQPVLTAIVANGRIKFNVDETGINSPSAIDVRTKLVGESNWVDYLQFGLPLDDALAPTDKQGEVFLIAEYSDGCRTQKLHYEFDANGTLTPLGTTIL